MAGILFDSLGLWGVEQVGPNADVGAVGAYSNELGLERIAGDGEAIGALDLPLVDAFNSAVSGAGSGIGADGRVPFVTGVAISGVSCL